MQTKKFIMDNLLDTTGNIHKCRRSKDWFKSRGYLEVYNDIIKLTSFLNKDDLPKSSLKNDNVPMGLRMWIIINDIKEHPLCTCGRKMSVNKNKFISTCGVLTCNQMITNRRNSCIEIYGTNAPYQNEAVKQKGKNTCKERYGVENVYQSEKIKETIKKRNKEKYGVEHYSQTPEYKNKFEKTMLDKYNATNPNYINGDKFLYNCLRKKKLLMMMNDIIDKQKIANLLGVSYSAIQKRFQQYGIKSKSFSNPENELYKFIEQIYDGKIIKGDRTILNNLELDIYLPEENLAIEMNGIYWHSSKFKDKNYHLNKTNKCEELGIQLFHIFDVEWTNPTKQGIWKSIILNKLGKNDIIDSKHCSVKKIKTRECKDFIDDNHLEGYSRSSHKLGLYFGDELISSMTFRNKSTGYELVKFCNKKGYNVINSFDTLLTDFKKSNTGVIILEANRRWSGVGLYEGNFSDIGLTSPNYYYIKNNSDIIESRIKYQKHKLKSIVDNFDASLSEQENMLINHYHIIYDSGNIKYKE